MHCNLLKKSILRDTKLLVWGRGINFSFTEEENFKGILNNFLNWFKFALIELIFTCPKSKFLRCLDFVFFTNEKSRFSNFIWLLPWPFKVSWDKLFEDFEFYSVSVLSLSKASWERDHFPSKKCLGKFYVKLTYLEQE